MRTDTEDRNQPNNDDNNLSLLVEHKNSDQNKPITNKFILARRDIEKLHFRTVQQALNKLNLRVRAVDQSNALYICHDDHWRQETNNYIKQMNGFVLVGDDINTMNNHYESILKTMTDQIVSTLHHLFVRKAITIEQYEQMMYFNQVSTFRINKLYFIPEVYKKEIILQPMLTSYLYEPIQTIARFLNILLEPLYEQTTRSISFRTGMDAIQAFEKYAEQGFLQPTTLFITVQIHDLCVIFSHDFMIEALQNFLRNHTPNQQIQGISTSTIIQLVQLILQNQYFLYENQLYQQVAGGPLNTPLTQTLTNIYLFYWLSDFVSILQNKKEIFGRCLNQFIFTWNESKDKLQILLNQMIMNHFKNSHIRITTSIGHEIHYFDAKIGHVEGILQTNVYHQSNIEPYSLPYVYDTTKRQDHLFLLRAALIRAVAYCSNVVEFENERFYIELSFLINDASFDFIQETIQKFFREFHAYDFDIYSDQATYNFFRENVQKYHRERTKYHLRNRKQREKRRQLELLPTNSTELLQKQMNIISIMDNENLNNMTIHTNGSLKQPEENKHETNIISSIDEVSMETKMNNVNVDNLQCMSIEEDREKIVEDYWNISQLEFKQRLLASINDDLHPKSKIQQWLETNHQLLQFVRQRSCLIASVYSLKMEQDFWKIYQNHTRIEALWLSSMSKPMLVHNNISETFFTTQNYMNKHLKIMEHRLREAIAKLNEHLQEQDEQAQFFKLSTIDMNLLSAIILAFVRQDQSQLRQKYEEKNSQLMLTVNDIRLVKDFYDLKPNNIQISYATRIWQTMIYEQQAKKEIDHTKRNILDTSDTEFFSILQNITVDTTHIMSTVTEFKQRFLTEIISSAEAKVEWYMQIIENEKQQFLIYSQEQRHLQFHVETILNSIERRRRTLTDRVQLTDEFSNISGNENYNDDSDDSDD